MNDDCNHDYNQHNFEYYIGISLLLMSGDCNHNGVCHNHACHQRENMKVFMMPFNLLIIHAKKSHDHHHTYSVAIAGDTSWAPTSRSIHTIDGSFNPCGQRFEIMSLFVVGYIQIY